MSLTEWMEGVHILYFCCTQSVFLKIKGLLSVSFSEFLACFFVNSPKVLASFDYLGLKIKFKNKFVIQYIVQKILGISDKCL